MTFLDRFRQPWKQSDPATRAEAVRQLGADDREVIEAVAREDPDATVRRIAVKRIDDATTLLELASSDADDSVRRLAAERAGRALTMTACGADAGAAEQALALLTRPDDLARVACEAGSEAIAAAALARVLEDRTVAEVARHAAMPAIRSVALTRVVSVSTLRRIAIDDSDLSVALAAVDRIEDARALRRIVRKSHTKAVKRRAVDKLQELGEDVLGSGKKRRAEQLGIVTRVETLQGSFASDEAAHAVETAMERWAEIGDDAVADLKHRFETATQAFTEQRGEVLGIQREQLDDLRARDERAAAFLDLCDHVESLAGESIPAELEQARERWAILEPPLAPDGAAVDQTALAALARRFEKSVADARRRHQRLRAEEERRARIPEILMVAARAAAEPNLARAARAWSEVERAFGEVAALADDEARTAYHGAEMEISRRLEAERERRAAEENRNLARIEKLCDRLEHLAEDRTLRDVVAGLKDGQAALKKLGPLPPRIQRAAMKGRLSDATERLHARAQELREAYEWEHFALDPVREELCKHVETLVEEPDIRAADRALRDLRKRWNETSLLPKGRPDALAERFNRAARLVRSRCDEHFAKLADERKQNLAKKEELCARAEALAESTDWKETAQQLQGLQAEWKEIGEIPRARAEAVWKRFRKACDAFFSRRKDHFDQQDEGRQKNLEQKLALIARAEELQESTDWERTTQEMRRLQADWKAGGPAPRSQAEEVWRRFRKACDVFFDRRSRRDEIAREAQVGRLEEIIAALTALQAPENGGEPRPAEKLRDELKKARTDWLRAGPPPAHRAALQQEFDGAMTRLIEANGDAFRGTDLDPEVNRKKREELCEKVEALKPPTRPSVDQKASLDEMVAQLRRALRTNPPRDPAEEWKDLEKKLDRLQAAWERVGPVPGDLGRQLDTRFEKACRRFQNERRSSR